MDAGLIARAPGPGELSCRARMVATLNGEAVDRPPLWLMRQAGRYLPEYRAVRKEHTFLEMVHTPELAMEVTLQPLRRFGIDAAILFSDILTIPEAMGLNVQFPEGGPTVGPVVRTLDDVARLTTHTAERLSYVGEAVKLCRAELPHNALLGFSGAPWTLACYMVEGKGTRQFDQIKRMLWQAPDVMRALLDKLADAVIDYLCMQLDAGADAVQLFDTWASELRAEDYDAMVRPSTERIVRAIQARGGKIIVFARHSGPLLASTLSLGADAYGLDARVELADARRINPNAVLQGNLDPIELFAPAAHIERRIQAMHAATGGRGWIANLGHGCIPETPIAGVEAFVSSVHGLAKGATNGAVRAV